MWPPNPHASKFIMPGEWERKEVQRIKDKRMCDTKLVGNARKNHILKMMEDVVSDLMYYDRKEDEDLPLESIEEAIAAGEVTVEEITAEFKKQLIKG